MRDSDTYMAIVEEGLEKGVEKGRLEEVKKIILRLGRKSLGTPSKRATASVDAISDIDRLESLLDRITDVTTWRELLAK